jgi:hypothetical protein
MAGEKRHETNPFTNHLSIKTRTKKLTVRSKLGSDENDVFINHTTGEVLQTTVTSYRQVDDEEFVKVFAQNIGMTFNLTSSGIKAFNILLWCVQYRGIGRDLVQLDHYSLGSYTTENPKNKMSLATLYRGIKELTKAQILARNVKTGFYYLNPSFCFNGDRIVFMNAIERKKQNSENETSENQSEIDYKK